MHWMIRLLSLLVLKFQLLFDTVVEEARPSLHQQRGPGF